MVKNRGTRKALRKVSIADVEEALEDERLASKLKRRGGKRGAASGGGEPFTIDVAGSSAGLPASARRELARAKLFPAKGPNLGLSASEEGKVARAERKLAVRQASASGVPEVFDLWAVGAEPAEGGMAGFKVRKQPVVRPQAPPSTMRRGAGVAPAVLPAHEGQSVNPDTPAYEELACLAAARQLELEHEAEGIERKLQPVTCELRDAFGAEALEEMDEEGRVRAYRSLSCRGPAAADMDGEGEGEGLVAPGPAKRASKQKSQAQRNRERKRKDMDARQLQLRKQRKLEKSVGAIGSIMKELKEQGELQRERKAHRVALRAKRNELEQAAGVVPECRRLGKNKFSEEAIAVPEAQAAAKGLRAMPLKSCAVKDRLSSILRRGMLPPPPEASKAEKMRLQSGIRKLKRSRKFASPLLRESLLLR